jgi:hypothetical protein
MSRIKIISEIKTGTLFHPLFLFGLLPILGVAIILLSVVKPLVLLVGSLAFLFVLFVVWIIKTNRVFQAIFLLLFIVGFFQGFIDKLKIIFPFLPPNTLWGPLKYFLMSLLLLKYISKIFVENKTSLNSGMRLWLGIWLLNLVVFSFLIAEAIITEPRYRPIGAIQTFGIGNMLLCIMVYFDSNQRQVFSALKIFVWFGVLAALFGILQRLLGPPFLTALGFDLFDSNAFAFLGSANMETNHLDVEKGFRAFSFFASHHAFSAFLILSTLSLQILRLQNKITSGLYFLILSIFLGGFIVTFNLTNLISCILILIIAAILQYAKKLKSLFKVFLRKSVLRNIVILILVSACTIIFIEPLRDRVAGIFEVSENNAGAGGSMYHRLEFISSGLNALSEHPLGLGLNLQQISDSKSILSGFARHNFIAENNLPFSADSWFLWLLVQLGLPLGILYFLLFIIPLIVGWKSRNIIKNKNLEIISHGILALLFVTFLGGISNSPILVFPPCNLFVWAAVGLLLKIPSWDREQLILNNTEMKQDGVAVTSGLY